MSKKVKLAVLRENDQKSCPFGLSIPFACKSVGNVIYKMASLDSVTEDQVESLKEANNHLFRWNNSKQKCPFATKVFEDKDIVDCNFETNTEGINQDSPPIGSPLFHSLLKGVGLDGLYSIPLGYYSEQSVDRGMYYGQYGLESPASITKKDLVKKTEDNEE